MRELPPPLNTIPPLVVSVKLAGSDRFTDSVKDAFLSLVKDQDLELKAVSKEDDYQTCTLTSPDGNILNLMCERLARTAYREETFQAGRQAMVKICSLKQSATSSWSIYVQLVDRLPKIEEMQNKVNENNFLSFEWCIILTKY
jgi:hypothetical protein